MAESPPTTPNVLPPITTPEVTRPNPIHEITTPATSQEPVRALGLLARLRSKFSGSSQTTPRAELTEVARYDQGPVSNSRAQTAYQEEAQNFYNNTPEGQKALAQLRQEQPARDQEQARQDRAQINEAADRLDSQIAGERNAIREAAEKAKREHQEFMDSEGKRLQVELTNDEVMPFVPTPAQDLELPTLGAEQRTVSATADQVAAAAPIATLEPSAAPAVEATRTEQATEAISSEVRPTETVAAAPLSTAEPIAAQASGEAEGLPPVNQRLQVLEAIPPGVRPGEVATGIPFIDNTPRSDTTDPLAVGGQNQTTERSGTETQQSTAAVASTPEATAQQAQPTDATVSAPPTETAEVSAVAATSETPVAEAASVIDVTVEPPTAEDDTAKRDDEAVKATLKAVEAEEKVELSEEQAGMREWAAKALEGIDKMDLSDPTAVAAELKKRGYTKGEIQLIQEANERRQMEKAEPDKKDEVRQNQQEDRDTQDNTLGRVRGIMKNGKLNPQQKEAELRKLMAETRNATTKKGRRIDPVMVLSISFMILEFVSQLVSNPQQR